MKEIPLGRTSYVAIVDDTDFEELSKYKWYALRHRTGKIYAMTTIDGRTIFMHRSLMGASKFSEKIDHINGDSLDNQRANMRVCTNSENMMNRGITRRNKSGAKGIQFKCGKWTCVIGFSGKAIYLGRFENLDDAKKAYDLAAEKYHGIFARKNGG